MPKHSEKFNSMMKRKFKINLKKKYKESKLKQIQIQLEELKAFLKTETQPFMLIPI
jgi:hypothetical protein